MSWSPGGRGPGPALPPPSHSLGAHAGTGQSPSLVGTSVRPHPPFLTPLVPEEGCAACAEEEMEDPPGNARQDWCWGRGPPGGCRCDWASVCQAAFTEVVGQKRQQPGPDCGVKRRREEARQRDQDFYVPYRPKDFDSERG